MTEIAKPMESALISDCVQKWYVDFVDVEQEFLYELVKAANYMDIKPLLSLTCSTIACMFKGKEPYEIRRKFNIRDDFAPEGGEGADDLTERR